MITRDFSPTKNGPRDVRYLWKLSTILRCTLRSFLVRWSSMRASTRHSMK